MKNLFCISLIFLNGLVYSQDNLMLEIINSVLDHDLSIQKSHQETIIALEEYKMSLAQLYPNLQLNLEPIVSYNSEETLKTGLSQVSVDYNHQLPSGGNISLKLKNQMTINTLEESDAFITQKPQLDFYYSQPLFLNGKIVDWELIPNQIKNSHSQYQSALYIDSTNRSQRIIDALRSYSTAYYSQLKKDYYLKRKNYSEIKLKNLNEEANAGIITIKEIWEQELSLFKAEIELQEAEAEYSQNILNIIQTTGLDFSELSQMQTPDIQLEELPDANKLEQIEDLPVVKEAKKQINDIETQAMLTDLEYSSNLGFGFNLTPHYASNRAKSSEFGASFSDFMDENAGLDYSASISITIPLYQGGKNFHDRNKNKASLERAKMVYKENLKNLQHQYQDLLEQLKNQENYYQVLSRQYKLSIKRYEDSLDLLSMGFITPLESESLLLDKINSEILLDEARNSIFLSKMNILLFLGYDIYNILIK
ncbi:MAG: TolC family protein [Spirochaetales bacterium]|nr:TolC family protein [Spirochaetales bacterium]